MYNFLRLWLAEVLFDILVEEMVIPEPSVENSGRLVLDIIPAPSPRDLHSPQLSHISSDDDETPRKVKWDCFVSAFSAQQLHGLVWQFAPLSELGLPCGIRFGQLHPDTEIPFDLVRFFDKRLKRAYS